MPHIHTEPGQHDLTASAFIVRTDTPEPTIMLHLHKKLNRYMQFGGHVELHETPWQAVIHELREESGYDMNQLDVLQPLIRIKRLTGASMHPAPLSCNTHLFKTGMNHFHTDIEFALITSELPRNSVEDGESNNMRLFTLDELLKLSGEETFENIREIAIYVLRDIVPNWERVSTSEFAA